MPVALILAAALAQSAAGATIDLTIPPGANFDKAEFRLWSPPSTQRVRATLVLVRGSNGDGRPRADEPFWQEFAARHRLAIVACRFTDKPHEQAFIEHYVNVSRGSGQALALLSRAAREMPGILFVGEKDLSVEDSMRISLSSTILAAALVAAANGRGVQPEPPEPGVYAQTDVGLVPMKKPIGGVEIAGSMTSSIGTRAFVFPVN